MMDEFDSDVSDQDDEDVQINDNGKIITADQAVRKEHCLPVIKWLMN